jgi:hypothetical protein
MMTKLKLTVNEQKTRRCHLPEDTFTFLGYRLDFGPEAKLTGGHKAINDSSKIVGWVGAFQPADSFLLSGGVYTTFAVPGATMTEATTWVLIGSVHLPCPKPGGSASMNTSTICPG